MLEGVVVMISNDTNVILNTFREVKEELQDLSPITLILG